MSGVEARLHAATLSALVSEEVAAVDREAAAGSNGSSEAAAEPAAPAAPRWKVASPAPGWFRPSVQNGQILTAAAPGQPATCLGELEILGQLHRLTLPSGAGAVVLAPRFTARTRVAVAYGEELLSLDGSAAVAGAAASTRAGAGADTARGLVVRAPSSGRFYGRPGPQKPPFLAAGDLIERGHTVCLLEVMKTFHRVTFDDPTLPERAKVVAVLVAEESDVVAGQPLVEIEPA
jgi:acetyl-CoA carboxylase biotin carboxyl carrier protein